MPRVSIKQVMKDAIGRDPDLMVPWYLLACYAYYEEGEPFLSDSEFHEFATALRKEWDGLEHPHLEKILRYEDVKANTFLGEFPARVGESMKCLRQRHKK